MKQKAGQSEALFFCKLLSIINIKTKAYIWPISLSPHFDDLMLNAAPGMTEAERHAD